MEIEIKTTKLTKSKILQMDYFGVPKNNNVDVLGWVNIDKKRYVIVKQNDCYYRAEFILKVEKEIKGVQFPSSEGGWEFPHLTNVKVKTHNGGIICFSVDRDDEKNISLYNDLVSFTMKTRAEGQIYY